MYCCLVPDPDDTPVPGVLDAIARSCSPRVMHDVPSADGVVLADVRGLRRAVGTPREIADEIAALVTAAGLRPRLALATTMTAAWVLATSRRGVTVVAGDEASLAAALGPLPVRCLDAIPLGADEELFTTLERWGMRTLSDVARLPRAGVRARLGAPGLRVHQAACGEDAVLLVPTDPAACFVERLELEWPIEGLEPLAFVLSRVCESLSAALERADRGAVQITTRLSLVTREEHCRTLRLPAPMRDPRVLRTLIMLDLESHPPAAGIDVVEVGAEVAPGQIVQGTLLSRAHPPFEELATLLARLKALMGETRVGAPARVDSHDDRMVAMRTFAPRRDGDRPEPGALLVVLRRFRMPIAARVSVDQGFPVRVHPAARGLPGGAITVSAGPWRSSGHWWATEPRASLQSWDRDEWDVGVADGPIYRLSRDRSTGRWQVEGVVD